MQEQVISTGKGAGQMHLAFSPESIAQVAIQGFNSGCGFQILGAAPHTAHDPIRNRY